MTKKGAVAARTAAVKRRTFTREFKLKVIREVEAGKSQAQVAREYQITKNTISKWRRQHRQYQDRGLIIEAQPALNFVWLNLPSQYLVQPTQRLDES